MLPKAPAPTTSALPKRSAIRSLAARVSGSLMALKSSTWAMPTMRRTILHPAKPRESTNTSCGGAQGNKTGVSGNAGPGVLDASQISDHAAEKDVRVGSACAGIAHPEVPRLVRSLGFGGSASRPGAEQLRQVGRPRRLLRRRVGARGRLGAGAAAGRLRREAARQGGEVLVPLGEELGGEELPGRAEAREEPGALRGAVLASLLLQPVTAAEGCRAAFCVAYVGLQTPPEPASPPPV